MGGSTLEVGDPRRISEYQLTGRIAESDQRIVYLAETPTADRVTVTRLRGDATTDPALPDLLAEGAVPSSGVAQFSVARVLDAGRDDDGPFVVSEYVDGSSLEAAVRRHGPLSGAALDRVAIITATGLMALHGVGLVHRALRPEHVLLGPGGPRIAGLGIIEESPDDGRDAAGVAYLAPEQIMGGPTGPPVDVFSWASTMVFAATGKSPFNASNVTAQRHQIVHWEPDLIAVPLPLADILARCLAKAPDARPTAPDLLLSLLGALRPELEHEDRAQASSATTSGDDQVSGPPVPADTPDPPARTPAPRLDPPATIPIPRLDPPGAPDSPSTDPPRPRRRGLILAAALIGTAVVTSAGATIALVRDLTVERTATIETTAPTRAASITTASTPIRVSTTTTASAPSTASTPTRASTATEASPTTGPTSRGPSATPPLGVSAAFAGTWSGLIHQPPTAREGLPLTLSFTQGSTAGTFRLPTLRCEAVLTVTGASADGRALTLAERLVTDPDGRCAKAARLVATLGSPGTLQVRWQDAQDADNVAEGLLTRQ